jgi:diguanylate cyclase (GGDEF)-like protein
MAILIVDDSADDRLLVTSILSSAGYVDLITAGSPRQAFRHLGMESPQGVAGRIELILMDLSMPEMDGVEACTVISEHPRLRDIPIVVMASCAEPANLEAAFAAGALDYVAKPPLRHELLARVRSCLRLKREIDRRRGLEQEAFAVTRVLDAAYQRLQHISFLDGLTGIANRRRFDQFLDLEWRRALRSESSLAVIMVDIDFFKAFNDTYGHQRGDDCLKQVAGALAASLGRPGDLAARYGGEEFVVVLSGTGRDGAVAVAETLRASVDALRIPHTGSRVSDHVTISIGVASLIPRQPAAAETLVAAADRALYQAKRGGRMCIRVADESASA